MTTGRIHSTVIAREIDMTAEIMPAYAYVEMTVYISGDNQHIPWQIKYERISTHEYHNTTALGSNV